MVSQEVIPYNIRDVAFHQLSSLEDAISKGYTVDDNHNKIEHISIASYPSLLFPALKYIKHDYGFFSTSHIERIALLYGISLLQEHVHVQNILETNSNITYTSQDEEVLRTLDVVTKLDFSTPSRCDSTSISILSWCREWINANCWALGLSKSQLCLYALIYGLDRYTIQNNIIAQHIHQECEHFTRYLERKNTAVQELIS